MIKFNDDFILYNENGNVILIGVNTGVDNIYSISKPFVLTLNDLEYAERMLIEVFNKYFRILDMFLSSDTKEELYVKMTHSFWEKVIFLVDFELSLKIIDDALAHGFEFKVENGDIYFREIIKS